MNNKGPEVVAKVIEKAMEGDVHCLKMCIDRILPVQKAVDPNRNKNDAQVIINVASIKSIEQKASEFDEAELVDVEEKDDDEVVVNVAADG
jgi:endoglucanase Acf2